MLDSRAHEDSTQDGQACAHRPPHKHETGRGISRHPLREPRPKQHGLKPRGGSGHLGTPLGTEVAERGQLLSLTSHVAPSRRGQRGDIGLTHSPPTVASYIPGATAACVPDPLPPPWRRRRTVWGGEWGEVYIPHQDSSLSPWFHTVGLELEKGGRLICFMFFSTGTRS